MKNILKGIGMWICLYLLHFLSNSLASTLALVNMEGFPPMPMRTVYIQTAAGLFLLALLAYFFWTILKNFKWKVEGVPANVLKVWWPILLYVIFFVGQFFLPASAESNNQEIVTKFIQNYPIVGFIQVVIFAPILEEMLFRGLVARYLFPKIEKPSAMIFYILLSGVLFSLVHNPTQIIHFMIYFTMGVSIAWLYVSKRDLRYPIALHMVNNLISFVMILLVSH